MPDETENHTLHLLQGLHKRFDDMEADNRAFRKEVLKRFDGIDERFDTLKSVFAGLSFITADGRAEIETIKTRLDRIERRLDLADSPAE